MFKNNLLLLAATLFFGLTFSSCIKKDSDNDVYVEPYVVTGIRDFEMKRSLAGYASYQLPLAVDYNNSKQEKVSLTVEGVPSGIYYTLTPTTGYPPFDAMLYFFDSAAAPGDYVIKLKAKSASTEEKVFEMNMKIQPPMTCVDAIVGTYYANSNGCLPFFGTSQQLVQRKDATGNRIIFKNFFSSGSDIEATMVCNNATVLLDKTTITYQGTSYEISGSGNYTTNGTYIYSVNFYLMVKNLTTNYTANCNAYMNR